MLMSFIVQHLVAYTTQMVETFMSRCYFSHYADELRGLEWNTRYGIIRGICEGLYHLHKEKQIYHMDLKPDNILLDNDMVPKITDFGLSRLDEKTKTMNEYRPGSLGYCAPEYLHQGKMSFKSDMYGLGMIIIQLVTGEKVIRNNNNNNVLRRWRHRWKKSGKETPLVYQQVAKCIEIGLLCQEHDPSKRPFIWEMIHDIREIEGINGKISNAYEHSFGQIIPYSEDDMLGIEPLELHFPFELNNQVSCALQLTNETDSYLAFNIQNMSPLSYCTQPQKGIMPPRSRCAIEVSMQLQGKAPGYMHRANELIVWSTKVNDCIAVEDITTNMFINEAVNAVNEVNLDVVFDAQIVLPQPSVIHCKDMSPVLGTIVSKDQVDSTQPQEANAETSENICISNDNLDGVSDDNPPVLHDRHTASEEERMHVSPSSVSTANAAHALQAPVVIEEHWVQCDICHKWRLLPYESDPTTLPEKWECSMQLWLPGLNRCHVGENETTNALNAQYVIPPPANGIPSVRHPHAGLARADAFSTNEHAEQSRKRKSFPGDGSALVDSSHPPQASAYSMITQPRPRIKSTADVGDKP